MSRLAFGIPTQTGAQAFKREVEGSLASWREMIEKDDARVVRSLHLPPLPNSLDGPMPVTIYQVAVRATGKIVQLSIQGKHDALPNPISSWAETQRSSRTAKGRSRSDPGNKLIAKRRLQDISEAEEAAAAAAVAYDDSGFDASGEYEPYDEREDRDADEENARRKRACTPSVRMGGETTQHWQTSGGCCNADDSMSIEVNLHPPTPRKPTARPSSRKPRPLHYAIRGCSTPMPPTMYAAEDARESLYPVVLPSSSTSEAGETYVTECYTAVGSEVSAATGRTVRRSSRLASLPPGSLEQAQNEAVQDATTRLHGVQLTPTVHYDMVDHHVDSAVEGEDVDMSSMIIDYEDEEESRLARVQYEAEEARQRQDLADLPPPPEYLSSSNDVQARPFVGLDGRIIKSEPELHH